MPLDPVKAFSGVSDAGKAPSSADASEPNTSTAPDILSDPFFSVPAKSCGDCGTPLPKERLFAAPEPSKDGISTQPKAKALSPVASEQLLTDAKAVSAITKPSQLVKKYTPSPKDRILILCEGEVTEVNYIRAFVQTFHLPAERITVRHPMDFTPLGMVKTAVAELAWAPIFESQHGGKSGYTEVWCVFDRDQHASYDDAIAFGSAVSGIHLVPNMPCFEIWLLHHYSVLRKLPVVKATQVGKDSVQTEVLPDGNIREVTTRIYAPANPVNVCLDLLKKFVPNPKAMNHPEKYFEKNRMAHVFTAAFPVEKQDTAAVWSLMPELLIRLLAMKYDAEEIARIISGKSPA